MPASARRFLRLEEFAQHELCIWRDKRAIWTAYTRARPVRDTAGRIVVPGDPDLLRCFVQVNPKKERSPLAVDVVAIAKWIETYARRDGVARVQKAQPGAEELAAAPAAVTHGGAGYRAAPGVAEARRRRRKQARVHPGAREREKPEQA
jgi:hypothetical protein